MLEEVFKGREYYDEEDQIHEQANDELVLEALTDPKPMLVRIFLVVLVYII